MSSRSPHVRALILAGGSGTRLWPRSTEDHPKPFLALSGGTSLLRETYERAVRLAGEGNVFLSARRSHADLVRNELPGLAESRLVLEPMRRNTAPAIALSILAACEDAPGAVLAVLPSDQAVRDEAAFLSALETAVAAARSADVVVTLGIPPTRPETGFGYLEVETGAGAHARRVLRFVEKPKLADAERYLASGRFLWNAGIFVFRGSFLLGEMERLCPEILAAARAAFEARKAGDGAGFDRTFGAAPSVSIDYAVMEKTAEVLTVPCACGWSDLGSWDAVFDFRGGSGTGNVTEGPVICSGGAGNLVLAAARPVRLLGVSDLVVVDAPEGLLVMRRGDSDALRKSVEESLAVQS